MLTLTRKLGESVVIGDDVRVSIEAIGGGVVRIGVEAPRDVPVHREEVAERIARERAAAERRDRLAVGEDGPEEVAGP